MQDGIPESFPVDVSRKWLSLAERRKAHLVDLYKSGRWRLYYDEAEFVSRLREANREIDLWSSTEQTSLGARRNAAVLRGAAGNGAAANGVAVDGVAGDEVAADELAADDRIYLEDDQRGASEID